MTPLAAEFAGTARFQLLRRIGAGGMGVVYEALDRERKTRVALKTLRTLSADALLRFKNEFRALQDLQHPNLVRARRAHRRRRAVVLHHGAGRRVDFLEYVRLGASATSPADRRSAT